MILLVISLAVIIIYVLLISTYLYGWVKLPVYRLVTNYAPETSITVIIPARNEEQNIENCIHDLQAQNYPDNLLEIIIVDDHSTDNTYSLALNYVSKNLKVYKNVSDSLGKLYKKQAITYGISKASGQLIVTTDADCRFDKNRILSVASYYEKFHPKMIAASVSFSNIHTFLEKFQAIEFMSLMGSTGGSLYYKLPLMCNGANLAFEKKVFDEMEGYKGNEHIASGDDMFLMQKVKTKYPSGIHFLKSKEANVNTKSATNFHEFIQQRKRWAAKNKHYKSVYIKMVSITVLLANIALIGVGIISIFDGNFGLFAFCFSLKLIADTIFLIPVSQFFQNKKLLIYLPFFQLIYPIYVLVVGLLANIGSYEWKGRVLKD